MKHFDKRDGVGPAGVLAQNSWGLTTTDDMSRHGEQAQGPLEHFSLKSTAARLIIFSLLLLVSLGGLVVLSLLWR